MPENSDLFVALYTDEDVNPKLAKKIRERGHDARSAHEEGNLELSDVEQLKYATGHGRAILTHNTKDFEPLYRKWLAEGKEHAGIIVSTKIEFGELLRRILRLLNHITADEMRNTIQYLSDFAERKKTKQLVYKG
jgi:predicted nuclease of predicted toxin-antitoxin system